MNKKKIILLLLALVVLIGVLALVVSLPDKESTKDDTKAGSDAALYKEQEVIYTANYESINKITLHSDEDYVFVKEGIAWKSTSHADESFNSSMIGSLATRISSVKATSVIDGSKINPSDCGIDLDKPNITFECNLGSVKLYLGDMLSSYEGYYVMTGLSDDVYVITEQTRNLIFEPLSDYKKETNDRVDYSNITIIEFKNENCSFSLRNTGADVNAGKPNAWEMVSPIKVEARDAEVDSRIIEPLSKLYGERFLSDKGDYENYGLATKENYIILTDAGGVSQSVYFSGEIGGKCYVSVEGSEKIYEIGQEGSSPASIRLIDIASRYVYTNRQSNISRIKVEAPGEEFDIDFSLSPHIIINGNEIKDSNECNELFYSVCAILADDISTEGVADSEITITYELKDSGVVVASFSPKDARYYSVSIDANPVYTILKTKIDASLETMRKYSK